MNKPYSMIQSMIDSWNAQIARVGQLIDQFSDEELSKDVAENRNSGTYLLGHLVAVHDAMLPLLGGRERFYPELEEPFLRKPDKSGLPQPGISELRAYWKTVNEALTAHFNQLTEEQWLGKHSSVSQEDFEKEPHRNKLSVLLSRTNHLSYHYGQLAFLKQVLHD